MALSGPSRLARLAPAALVVAIQLGERAGRDSDADPGPAGDRSSASTAPGTTANPKTATAWPPRFGGYGGAGGQAAGTGARAGRTHPAARSHRDPDRDGTAAQAG